MSEELALSLLEELLDSQKNLAGELNDLALQVEFADRVEFENTTLLRTAN